MKVLKLIKKNTLVVFVVLAYFTVFIIAPQKAKESLGNSVYYLLEMLQVLPIIFLLTVLIEAWVPKDLIMKGLGDKSGVKGNLLSILFGSISAGPIYAAFPIGKALLSKGASITNIVIIISSWAVIKVPMLANEVKFLGIDFMIVRWILTVISILAMGYLTAVIVKKKDLLGSKSEHKQNFTIREEYCIGCGICSKMAPEIYNIRDKKAIVKLVPDNDQLKKVVIETVKKCPTSAIVYETE